MSPAASELEYAIEGAVDRPTAIALPPDKPGLFQRLLAKVKAPFRAYFHRGSQELVEPAAGQFQWDVSVQQLGHVRPEAVYCIELPVSDPVGMFAAYVRAGVAPDHVVFVGDSLTLKDEAYYAITRMGALVHETPKKGRRVQAQQELAAYFAPADVRAGAPPTPKPYTYTPGPPKVTPKQLQELIDAIGRVRR